MSQKSGNLLILVQAIRCHRRSPEKSEEQEKEITRWSVGALPLARLRQRASTPIYSGTFIARNYFIAWLRAIAVAD
ncbi:MAG: hypothetical protein AAFQ89_01955 [Cyanobacteria bacterium J06626_18]